MRSASADRSRYETPEMSMEARHLIITGRVQGVAYRASMQQEARRLGITGWVRNRMDGNVEALVVGSDEAIAAIIAWAQHGPPAARVDLVQVEWATAEHYDGFEQRATG